KHIMINLSSYRIIDLSPELLPGELKIDGQYQHGDPWQGRPIEVQEFIAYNARMHFIQGQTHTGSHVEAPYKYSATREDAGSVPLASYIGEAVVCNFSAKRANEPITVDDLRQANIKTGDIVLAWGSAEHSPNPPYFTFEAIDWLIATRIKLLANEHLKLFPPGTPYGGSVA